jgi:hypothetical protein
VCLSFAEIVSESCVASRGRDMIRVVIVIAAVRSKQRIKANTTLFSVVNVEMSPTPWGATKPYIQEPSLPTA